MNGCHIVIVIVIFLQGVHSVKLIFSGALHIHTYKYTHNIKIVTTYITQNIYTKHN